jgi:hypothetical protein
MEFIILALFVFFVLVFNSSRLDNKGKSAHIKRRKKALKRF